MMVVTLTAVPRRITVLAAKAANLAGLVLVASAISVRGSLLIGWLVLPDRGFTAAHGYPLLSLPHGATLRAAGGSVLFLTLIGLLSLGIATTNLRPLPISPWAELGVLAAWAAAAVLGGGALFQLRDA